jgi:hypothetical protein
MSNQYRRTSKESLESHILIEIRNLQVKEIAIEFVKRNIVPKDYLNNLLKIDALKKSIPETPELYTDDKRIEKLGQLLQKECAKGTAKLITELTTPNN